MPGHCYRNNGLPKRHQSKTCHRFQARVISSSSPAIREASLNPFRPNCSYNFLYTVIMRVNGAYHFFCRLPDWVIRLGPEKNGLYEYSVATDPMKLGLYVLARDVETFKQKYEHEVIQFVTEQGFIDPINKPIAIPQNDNCLYPPKTFSHDASEL